VTEPRTDSTAQILRLAARVYLRYAAPLTLLAVVVLAPWLGFALAMPAPRDQASARAVLGASWMIGATAWIGQLLLVGAAAALVRALDDGAPPSQLRALGRGALQLARAAVRWLAAVAAIALGALALALPGLALLVLLSTTAASTRPGLPEPLAESAALVRRRLPLAAIAVAALLAVDLGAVVVAQAMLRPPPTGKLGPDQLAALRRILEVAAIAIVAIAPPIAALLAAVHTRAPRA
jgi:hypothetical protein